jgi:alpha-aminoadipate carrier protein LysW
MSIETNNGVCPICEGSIIIPVGTEESEILTCEDCGSRLVVESLSPVALSAAPEVEEDWGE